MVTQLLPLTVYFYILLLFLLSVHVIPQGVHGERLWVRCEKEGVLQLLRLRLDWFKWTRRGLLDRQRTLPDVSTRCWTWPVSKPSCRRGPSPRRLEHSRTQTKIPGKENRTYCRGSSETVRTVVHVLVTNTKGRDVVIFIPVPLPSTSQLVPTPNKDLPKRRL